MWALIERMWALVGDDTKSILLCSHVIDRTFRESKGTTGVAEAGRSGPLGPLRVVSFANGAGPSKYLSSRTLPKL